LRAQVLIKNSTVTGVCYAGNKIKRIYIPPPSKFYRKSEPRSGGTITFNFTGFPGQAAAALRFAGSILESLLPADTKFTINATWQKVQTARILAQSSITGFALGSDIDALMPELLYPVALAEKISGKSLNDDTQADINLVVNNSVNWYLGTDGKTPVQQYDLVTVVLHEICHGLGFFDSFNTDATNGFYGIASFPLIYDRYVENLDGNRLIDTLKFLNNSPALRSQLTGGQLYFNGPLLRNYTSGSRAKLYVPSTWDSGSSVSHLDESLATLPENSLMTPILDLGEAIHDPGKFTFSMLGDIGWINTRIIHNPSHDTEAHLSQLQIPVVIKSDTSYNNNTVGIVFTFDNFITTDSLYLSADGTGNSYNTTIPVPSYNSELKYYFFAEDVFSRLYRSPSSFRTNPYRVFIGSDTIKPVISHTPVKFYLQTVDSIRYDASVTDNLGIDSVYVEYKINNGASKFIRLNKGTADNYGIVFNARTLELKGHDSIQYKIFAVDTAKIPNLASLPEAGFFVTHIEEISATLSSYSTDFSNAAPDFFNIGFDVIKPASFSKYGLNTKHPYESPEDNNKTIEYTSILRHPLKFDDTGLLVSFNELVLVEPGEPGSVFGASDFYDYVIIEGSKDFGKSWFNLIDGYDSRIVPSWLSAYNSSITGDNSTFKGTESMLRKHVFLYRPSGKISAGDTLLLRFRLLSDPFANGWGWVIEDLKVGPLIDAVPETMDQPVIVYPNPGSGHIHILTGIIGIDNNKPLHYSVYNALGTRLINDVTSGSPETSVDISGYPAGMYIIVLYLDKEIKTIKYSLIK
jgi:hypothetical protein